MKHATLIKRIEKLGLKIENKDNCFWAKGTNTVVWYEQFERAAAVHTPSSQTDSMTDCFCDTFHHRVKDVIRYLTK
jgi:hypothetical protein